MEKFIMAGGCAVRINIIEKKISAVNQNVPESWEPVIVLLHGYLESLDIWDEFVPLLTDFYRIVRMDLPGHGISEVKGEEHTMEFLADTVKGMLDELHIDKCVLAGHSMGGYVCLEFLKKYPSNIDGLILFHSSPNPDSEEKKAQRKREIEIVRAGKKELLAETVEKSFAPDNRQKFRDIIDDLEEQVILTEDSGIIALLNGMMNRKDNNETLKKSTIPQLFLFGKKDEYILPDIASGIINNNPQAAVRWLENSGHMGFIEEPEKSAESLLSLLGQIYR